MITRIEATGGAGPEAKAGGLGGTFLIPPPNVKKSDFVPYPNIMMADNFFKKLTNSVLIMYLKWRFQAI